MTAGYRQHGFDPQAYEQPGKPLRPFNAVQWAGVGLELIGLALFLAHVGGTAGWIDPVPSAGLGFLPFVLGHFLIYSRREPSTLVGPEQHARNKRTLIITLAICAVIVLIALAIEFGPPSI